MNLKKEALKTLAAFLEKHKETFAEPMMPNGMPTEPKEYTTKDGGVIKIDTLAVGGKCMTKDGSPCQAGEIYLADGSTIYVDETGTITNIETPQVEGQEPAMEDMKKQCMELNAKVGEMLAQFSEQVNTAKEVFSQKDNEVETLKATVESQGKLLKEMYEVLSNFTTAEPITKSEPFKFQAKKTDVSSFIKSQLKK